MNTIEAIENTVKHGKEFKKVLQGHGHSNESRMARKDFSEESELILDGIFTQIKHHENRVRDTLEEAERLISDIERKKAE